MSYKVRSLYHLFVRDEYGRFIYMSSHTPSYYWSSYAQDMRDRFGRENVRIRFTMGEVT